MQKTHPYSVKLTSILIFVCPEHVNPPEIQTLQLRECEKCVYVCAITLLR